MLGTKLEITMPKAELGSWSSFNFPGQKLENDPKHEEEEKLKSKLNPAFDEENDDSDDESIDLDDVDIVTRSAMITELD